HVELVDGSVQEFEAKQEASISSREEPPLKKKKSEEKNGNQNDSVIPTACTSETSTSAWEGMEMAFRGLLDIH
ncbi:hypothetical protein MKW92_011294, partial [Papaver armeniacum]